MKSIEETQWHFSVKRPIYLLDASLILTSDIHELRQYAGKAYSHSFVVIEDGLGSYYAPYNEVNEQIHYLTQDITQAQNIISLFSQSRSRLEQYLKKIIEEVELGHYSPIHLQYLFDKYRHFVPFRIVTRVVGYREDLPDAFIEQAAQARMQFKEAWTVLREELERLWVSLARLRGFSEHILKAHTCQECLWLFENLPAQSARVRNEVRRRKIVLYRTRWKEMVVVGKEAERFLKAALREEPDKETACVISGRVACQGYAQGEVKVIFQSKGVKIEKPFILVTSMTTPDFVPLLKYAQAIVTDEGGLTCHAAIISREFNIPCVIGTKIATKVLRDGDSVEVDAWKGVVSKLTEWDRD